MNRIAHMGFSDSRQFLEKEAQRQLSLVGENYKQLWKDICKDDPKAMIDRMISDCMSGIKWRIQNDPNEDALCIYCEYHHKLTCLRDSLFGEDTDLIK